MLSTRLSYLRKRDNKTQEDISKLLGITRPAYTAYESGRRQPDYETLQKLADYFDTTTDYLLGRTDNPEPIRNCNKPDFTQVFEAPNLGDAIVRIVNICAEFNLSKDVMFEMFNQAVKKYGMPGGVGGVAAHGPSFPGSGVLDEDEKRHK